jgi:biopolymer transport protein TolR
VAFGRLERRTGANPMSDINMTPLIDVMLVLLVIFMITAPLMTSSLKQLYWGDEALDAEALKRRVREAARRNPATEVQLRADKSVSYGRIAELIGLVQEGGLSRIGFVTESKAAGGS